MRARDIKPGFFKNDILAECDPFARLLFAGLWMLADREGRLECRPRKIKAEILPYDNVDIDDLLGELEAAGFIAVYEAAGMRCIWIPKFLKHQRPHQNEVPSILPPYEERSASDQGTNDLPPRNEGLVTLVTSPCDQGCGGVTPTGEALRPSSLTPSSLTPSSLTPSSLSPDTPPNPPEGGARAEDEKAPRDFELSTEAPPQKKTRAPRTDYRRGDFEELWAKYPQHSAEERARKTWEKMIKSGELADQHTLMAAITWQVSYWREQGRPIDKIPYLARWLSEKLWNDEQPKVAFQPRPWLGAPRRSKEQEAHERNVANVREYLASVQGGRQEEPHD